MNELIRIPSSKQRSDLRIGNPVLSAGFRVQGQQKVDRSICWKGRAFTSFGWHRRRSKTWFWNQFGSSFQKSENGKRHLQHSSMDACKREQKKYGTAM